MYSGNSSKIILMVDDDEDDRALFQEAAHQYKDIICSTAENGLDALTHLSNGKIIPDLIFMDINMPVMGGMECLEKIKNSEKLKHLPVAIYSTAKTAELEMLAQSCGAFHFFQKPVSFEGIVDCIRSAFKLAGLAIKEV